jgi:hypothetical protein
MKYEAVVYGNTAVISRAGEQITGDPPATVTFHSPDGYQLPGPPLAFERFETWQEADAWARERAVEVIEVK